MSLTVPEREEDAQSFHIMKTLTRKMVRFPLSSYFCLGVFPIHLYGNILTTWVSVIFTFCLELLQGPVSRKNSAPNHSGEHLPRGNMLSLV